MNWYKIAQIQPGIEGTIDDNGVIRRVKVLKKEKQRVRTRGGGSEEKEFWIVRDERGGYPFPLYNPHSFKPLSTAASQSSPEATESPNIQLEVGMEGTYPVGSVEYPVKIIGKSKQSIPGPRGTYVDKYLWEVEELTSGRKMSLFQPELFKPIKTD